MHLVAVDPPAVVVELEPAGQLPPHAESVRSLNPPWNSYAAVMSPRISRASRSPTATACASASGRWRSASTAANAWGETATVPGSVHARHTAPPERGRYPASGGPAPHSAQLCVCGW